MKRSRPLSILLTALAVSSAATQTALSASPAERLHPAVHRHAADYAKAKALVPPASPAAATNSGPETDGLGRNDRDCNYRCIDH